MAALSFDRPARAGPQTPNMATLDRVEGLVIEGIAIVSADGMIADLGGIQPPGLLIEADQRFFRETLDAADVLVHGRNSSEGGARAERRRRIVLTRQIATIAHDPDNKRAVLWNPAGAAFSAAWALLAPAGGRATVIGGTEVFGLFLGAGYDRFHLTRTSATRLPGGRPVFPGVPERTPEELLIERGLKPESTCVLDRSAGLTATTWRRES